MINGIVTTMKWIAYIGKTFFGYTFTAFWVQKLTEDEYILGIINSIPSKFAMWMGVFYGAFWLVDKISLFYHKHMDRRTTYKTNLLKYREERENLEQKEIETEGKRQGLNNDN